MQFLVVGNPENRRVQLFLAAARRMGCPEPWVEAWIDVARDPERLLAHPDGAVAVRLDSLGENAAVDAALLQRGRAAALVSGCEVVGPEQWGNLRFGQIVAPRQSHLGFLHLLDALEEVWRARPGWEVLQPPQTIRTCFDKNATARLLRAAGVPVAPGVDVADVDDLMGALEDTGGPLWVKLSCGSSASCLGVLRSPLRPHLMTTVRQTPEGRFNSLRVCRVQGPRLRPLCAWLLGEGVRVEQDVRKAHLGGVNFDLRVLLVRGEPRFCIVRHARHPITNLHLGGWRGDTDALWEALGPAKKALEDLCRAVGEALPHWYLGIDIVVLPGFQAFVVLEVNAFGDLLPRSLNAGLDTYGAEIAAWLPSQAGRMLGLG